MKLDLYAIDLLLAQRGATMRSAGFDYRWIRRAKAGKDLRPTTVRKIADMLGATPDEITRRTNETTNR